MEERKQVPWEPFTTLNSNPVEGRDLKTYEATLGFKINQLEGTILDVGSGRDEIFSKEAQSANKKIKVISLNPDYFDSYHRFLLQEAGEDGVLPVAGLAEEMPFKDESFEYVFANYSLTVYSDPKEMDEFKQMWVSEINRVLKSGGEARLYPFCDFLKEDLAKHYKDFLDFLTSLNLEYSFESANFTYRGLSTFRLIIKKR